MQKNFANDAAARRVLREVAEPFTSRSGLILLSALSLLAGIVGPFGTYGDFSIMIRLFYWTTMVLCTASVGHATATLLEWLLARTGWPVCVRLGLISLLVAVPVCLVVVVVSAVFGSGDFVGDLALLYVQCLTVTGIVIVLGTLSQPVTKSDPIPSKPEIPALLARLPEAKRGRLVRLTARDHYVEIFTENGSVLIATRFRDAVAQTAPEPGLQTHRSHWVALHAVTGRCRQDKRSGLRLADGSFVPVGRTYRAAVRKAVSA